MPVPSSPPADDFGAAALRFYDDAAALLAQDRWDGAVYLSGYVQECSLKFRLCARYGLALAGKDLSHDVARMSGPELCLSASLGIRTPAALKQALGTGQVIDYEHPERRYWPSHWTRGDAEEGVEQARVLLSSLVVRDLLDHGGALP